MSAHGTGLVRIIARLAREVEHGGEDAAVDARRARQASATARWAAVVERLARSSASGSSSRRAKARSNRSIWPWCSTRSRKPALSWPEAASLSISFCALSAGGFLAAAGSLLTSVSALRPKRVVQLPGRHRVVLHDVGLERVGHPVAHARRRAAAGRSARCDQRLLQLGDGARFFDQRLDRRSAEILAVALRTSATRTRLRFALRQRIGDRLRRYAGATGDGFLMADARTRRSAAARRRR